MNSCCAFLSTERLGGNITGGVPKLAISYQQSSCMAPVSPAIAMGTGRGMQDSQRGGSQGSDHGQEMSIHTNVPAGNRINTHTHTHTLVLSFSSPCCRNVLCKTIETIPATP